MPFPRGHRFGSKVWDRDHLRALVLEILRTAGGPVPFGKILPELRNRGYEMALSKGALAWRVLRILHGRAFRSAGRRIGWTVSEE